MKALSRLLSIAIISLAFAAALATLPWPLRTGSEAEAATGAARGKYLVEEIAKCTECHTPRDQNNLLDRDRWLQGAPIWIQPVYRTPNWADNAPALAGLSNYTDEQMERVLEKGEGVGIAPIQPPMHIYHMNHEDALAIIMYLRSLSRPLPKAR